MSNLRQQMLAANPSARVGIYPHSGDMLSLCWLYGCDAYKTMMSKTASEESVKIVMERAKKEMGVL